MIVATAITLVLFVADNDACDDIAFNAALSGGTAGVAGVPLLEASGLALIGAEHVELTVSSAAPDSSGLLLVSTASLQVPFLGGVLYPAPPCLVYPFSTDVAGQAGIDAIDGVKLETAHCGSDLFAQASVLDAAATDGWALTDALRLHLGAAPEPRLPLVQLFPMPMHQPVPLPGPVAVTDVDGDGLPDLIGLSINDDEGAVQLGDGDGGFGVPLPFPLLTNSAHVLVTPDLDGDGVPDLALGDSFCCPAGLTTLHGNGDGTFSAALLSDAGSSLNDLAAGDLDGDGQVDLAATRAVGDFAIYLAPGDGTLSAPLTFPTAGNNPKALALRDVDRDGDLDAIMTHDSNQGPHVAAVLRGDGTGSFGPPETYNTGGSRPRDLAFGDLDEDGIPDLLTIHPTQATYGRLLGQPDGTFGIPAVGQTGGSTPTTVALTHLDDDGHLDALFAHPFPVKPFVVRRGNGQGGLFQPQKHVVTGAIGNPSRFATADVDLDGKDEVLVSDHNAVITFEAGNAGGLVAVTALPLEGVIEPGAFVVGNVDGDGDPDVLTAEGDLRLFRGENGIGFSAPTVFPTHLTLFPYLALDDIDGDGLDDILASWFQMRGFGTSLSRGDGSFGPLVHHEGLPLGNDALATGDVNGDGLLDVALLHDQSFELHVGLGDGRFTPLGAIAVHAGLSQARDLELTDLDLDGRDDVVVLTSNLYTDHAWLRVYTDVATTPVTPPFVLEIDKQLAALVVGDVNGDTIPDVLAAELVGATDRSVVVLAGVGDGTLAPLGAVDDTDRTGRIALADVTGDGILDLLSGQTLTTAGVRVHPGLGDGRFARAQGFFSGGDFVTGIATGDLDQDGRIDVIVSTSQADFDGVAVLVNRGP